MNFLSRIGIGKPPATQVPLGAIQPCLDAASTEMAFRSLPAQEKAGLWGGSAFPEHLWDREWLAGQALAAPSLVLNGFRFALTPLFQAQPLPAGDARGPFLAALARWRSEELLATLSKLREEAEAARAALKETPGQARDLAGDLRREGHALAEYGHLDLQADFDLFSAASTLLLTVQAGRDPEAGDIRPQEAGDLARVIGLWYGLSSEIVCAYREWRYTCEEFRFEAGMVPALPAEEVPVLAAIRAALDSQVEVP